MSIGEALSATLAMLREKGWAQYTETDGKGRACLGFALIECSATGVRDEAFEAVLDEIGRQYGRRIDVVRWNDAPGRTFPDVERVLEKAIAEHQ